MEIKNQMSNALFLIYFSIVNGVETLSSTETPGLSRPAVSSAPGTDGGPCPAVVPPQEALLCVSAPSRTLPRAPPRTWRCQGTGLLSRVSRMLPSCGTGPRGLLGDGALRSHLTWWGALPAAAGARLLGRRTPPPCAVRRVGFSIPPKGTQCLAPLQLPPMKEPLGLFFGVVFDLLLTRQGKDMRTGRTRPVGGWGAPARGPGCALSPSYFRFCVSAVPNCKTNMSTIQHLY